MNLQEAMEQLLQGVQMHRAAWSMDDGYLSFMPGMKHFWKIVLNPNPNAGNYIFSIEDLQANDWQKFEMPREPNLIIEAQ